MEQKDLIEKSITRDLPVKLTEAEMAGIARAIGSLRGELSGAEMAAKKSASDWKDRITSLESRINDLAEKAGAGIEDRPVDCREVFDYRRGEVRVVRKDNGEELNVRPMTSDERQPSLPGTVPSNVVPLEKPKKGGRKSKAKQAVEDALPDDEPDVDNMTDDDISAAEIRAEIAESETDPAEEVTDPEGILDGSSDTFPE